MAIRLGQSAAPTDTRIYAIGDVHGYLQLLTSIHQKIRGDLENRPTGQYAIIFLGDYIDRGPDSAGCVQFLLNLCSEDNHVICLKGNHEDRLEQFLDNPLELAKSFFTYGGVECAQSYGVDMSEFRGTDKDILKVCDKLRKKIPYEHKRFYSQLSMTVTLGDYLFSHAGVRPGVSLEQQSDNDLMWIRSEFISNKSLYDKVIIHGHTPTYPMEILPNRINADTWAYDTGVLSCVELEGTGYRVIEA